MRRLLPLLLALLLLSPLLWASDYRLFQLTLVASYAIAILGLDLLTGYTGQISLGHGAFYALGAYTAAIAMNSFDWPYYATLPLAAAVSALFGYAFGFPALRLRGPYLALATFGLAVAIPQLLRFKPLEDWTGGVQGIVITKPDPPLGLSLSPDQWLYLFTLTIAALVFYLMRGVLAGHLGVALRAVRDHELAAEAMGLPAASLKTRAFAVSAMLTGLAGALGAIAVQFVAPDSFSLVFSITLFVGLITGGVTSLLGAVLGAIFVVFVPNLASLLSKAAPGAVYGLILIGFLFFAPRGAAGLIRTLNDRLGPKPRLLSPTASPHAAPAPSPPRPSVLEAETLSKPGGNP
jgi:branched-chain amino acid transport system permease protein